LALDHEWRAQMDELAERPVTPRGWQTLQCAWLVDNRPIFSQYNWRIDEIMLALKSRFSDPPKNAAALNQLLYANGIGLGLKTGRPPRGRRKPSRFFELDSDFHAALLTLAPQVALPSTRR